MNEEECRHGGPIAWCFDCKPRQDGLPRQVIVSDGGSAFHVVRDCRGMRRGQGAVVRRGGIPSDQTWMPTAEAIAQLRQPCEYCCPGGRSS
ncbi:hypothetical protein AB0M43_23255 [Longispora sp. NPDC051575]|uniref:hypothetical protein n=1 Tax=Longispora sp. NPDC051575 TaxID=3154943 RepID=UPI0034326610